MLDSLTRYWIVTRRVAGRKEGSDRGNRLSASCSPQTVIMVHIIETCTDIRRADLSDNPHSAKIIV